MATATIQIIPETKTVTLTMSYEEARCLRAVCGAVGGHPVLSQRKHGDTILRALNEIGLHENLSQSYSGGISFHDEFFSQVEPMMPQYPAPPLTCAFGEPWPGATFPAGHPLCDAATDQACVQFEADVAAGRNDAEGYTPVERRAQQRRQENP